MLCLNRIRLVCDASVICLFAVLVGLSWMPGVSIGQDSAGQDSTGVAEVTNETEAEQKPLRVTDLYVLERDAKLSEQIGQSPEQRTAFLVAMQQYRDVVTAGFRAKSGEQIDPAEQRKKMEAAQQKVLQLFDETQRRKIQEAAAAKRAEYAERFSATRVSNEVRRELSSMRNISSQLSRVQSDLDLQEKLGVSTKQRVELKEAYQKYVNASLEMHKSDAGSSMTGTHELLRELVMESQRM
ncbi:hypothetical protein [Rhodopirellula halodulae]|uniref:hypothetical protein n=1 Tax=Rhodopirellula halodulae TaxID=2894198 RepID=UPI001E3FA99F|nr:hypothetical protein [Rhodopirellula sp. JC737]MCC9658253.1 hypothetical protein [Rhodopirellula sp. JC737]